MVEARLRRRSSDGVRAVDWATGACTDGHRGMVHSLAHMVRQAGSETAAARNPQAFSIDFRCPEPLAGECAS